MPDQAATMRGHAKTILFRGKRLQMLRPATMDRDDITSALQPVTSTGGHQQRYQVHDLVNGVAKSMVQVIWCPVCHVRSHP